MKTQDQNWWQACVRLLITATALGVIATATLAQEIYAPCGGSQTPIVYGEGAWCSISPASNVDVYKFVGQIGDSARVALAGLSNDLDVQVEIINPDGTQNAITYVSAPWNGTASLVLPFTVSQGGIHYLLISDNGLNNAGDYALHLERTPPLFGAPTIDYGQSVTVTIDDAADEDWLRLVAVAGTHIQVTATGQSNDLDCSLELLDEAGNPITSNACSAPWNGTCSTLIAYAPVLSDGVYFVAVSDSGRNNTGTISVSVNCVFGNCPPYSPPVPIGVSYCSSVQNSTGRAAMISGFGSPVISNDNVHLVVTDAPAGMVGLFLFGLGPATLPVQNTWGTLCVLPPLKRGSPLFVGNNNTMNYWLDLGKATYIVPGTTWYHQAWFRDPKGPPPNVANLSDGLRIDYL